MRLVQTFNRLKWTDLLKNTTYNTDMKISRILRLWKKIHDLKSLLTLPTPQKTWDGFFDDFSVFQGRNNTKLRLTFLKE